MGMDFDELFVGKYLKAGQFKGREFTLTIAGIALEELVGDKGKEMKGIVSFKETPKGLVLNKTNGLAIKAMFGRDTGAWVGKRVTLYPAAIEFGDSDIAIRVKGSPDLPKDLEFVLALARKKPKTVKLLKTGAKPTNGNGTKTAQAPAHAAPHEPPPDFSSEPPDDVPLPGMDPVTGEVPFS